MGPSNVSAQTVCAGMSCLERDQYYCLNKHCGHQLKPHRVVFADLDCEYSPTGESADYRHRKSRIPQERSYRRYVHELFNVLPGFCRSDKNCPTFAAAGKIFAIGGEENNRNRARMARERFRNFIPLSGHRDEGKGFFSEGLHAWPVISFYMRRTHVSHMISIVVYVKYAACSSPEDGRPSNDLIIPEGYPSQSRLGLP